MPVPHRFAVLFFPLLLATGACAQTTTTTPTRTTDTTHAGNPVLPGWYADPEGAVLGDRYWI